MTAGDALERWSAAHDQLTRKELAMHQAKAQVKAGEVELEHLVALQDEVVHLRHHSDTMLSIAMEMLRLEKRGRESPTE